MENFIVATDSGCDLPAAFCRKRGIYAYRMNYSIQETGYIDSMSLENCAQFYQKMREGAVPVTSQMTPYEFLDFWAALLEEHHLPIVHIAMGSGISGTCANALAAKSLFENAHPGVEIYVVDSTLASIGYGMLCIWAADMRDQGKSPEDCVSFLENHKAQINTYYTTDDLKYLYRSGRVSKTGVLVATALNINPILNLDQEGHLVVREKIRGRKRAIARIYQIVEARAEAPQRQTVYICHSDCKPEEVKEFSETLVRRFGFENSFVSYIGPTIGSHSGPGLIAAFFLGKPRSV